MLSPDRLFNPDPARRKFARQLYESVAGLPIVSPHGHVDPNLLADPEATFSDPVELFILHDHYIYRVLHSQGIPLESIGIPRRDGVAVENDRRKIWRIFAGNFHLFRGMPTGLWLQHELEEVFGITDDLNAQTAMPIYDQLSDCLSRPEFRPRALFERFRIRTLCTTDAATDTLDAHQRIRLSGWAADVRPTFRPDALTDLRSAGWDEHLALLERACGFEIADYPSFIRALVERRIFFKRMGASATDHGVESPHTEQLSPSEAEAIFQRALHGRPDPGDAERFSAHLLMEMAGMSLEDGLVMQLHAGALRDHDKTLYQDFGPNHGADIPVQVEFTRNLRSLLNKYGRVPRFTLILFTLDESAYARELAPLAGYYPAVKLGPPWWFHDCPNGMRRFFDEVMETAGLYNTVGFNDDTRAFCSIPARHDVWRRVSCDWLAGQVLEGRLAEAPAAEMAAEMALGLALRAYRLDEA